MVSAIWRSGHVLALCGLLSSCATLRTPQAYYERTDTALRAGNPKAALAQVRAHTPAKKDRLLHLLDVGLLEHWSGAYEASNRTLTQAEDLFDELRAQSLSELPRRLLINDHAADYTGDEIEELYLHIFKALNYLALEQTDAAWVEVRKLDTKLIRWQRDYETAYQHLPHRPEELPNADHPFHESALARWLGMLLYRHEGRWDDVRIDQQRLQMAFSQQERLYPFAPPDLSEFRQPIQNTQARLSLIAFHGLRPHKEAKTLTVHTEQNVVMLSQTYPDAVSQRGLTGWETMFWPGVDPGLHFSLALPRLQERPSQVGFVEVVVNGKRKMRLQPLESMQTLTRAAFEQRLPLLYLRTLTRAIGKAVVFEEVEEELTEEMNTGWSALTRIGLGVLLDQTEQADLRAARFFPAETSIGELILPAGKHTIEFSYYSPTGHLIHRDPPRTIELRPHTLHLEQTAYLE
jgi:hypothetical protein